MSVCPPLASEWSWSARFTPLRLCVRPEGGLGLPSFYFQEPQLELHPKQISLLMASDAGPVYIFRASADSFISQVSGLI